MNLTPRRNNAKEELVTWRAESAIGDFVEVLVDRLAAGDREEGFENVTIGLRGLAIMDTGKRTDSRDGPGNPPM